MDGSFLCLYFYLHVVLKAIRNRIVATFFLLVILSKVTDSEMGLDNIVKYKYARLKGDNT
jgi:hypothetical protein